MSGKKRPTSVPERLQAFFRDNPHEELSVQDMTVKFGCTKNTIRDALRTMEGQMERVLVYRLKQAEPRA